MSVTKKSPEVIEETEYSLGIESKVLHDYQSLNKDSLETIEPSVFSNYKIPLIIEFLVQSHKDFMTRRLPQILGTASELFKNISSNKISHIGNILLSQFGHEMKEHFKYEEDNLFPYALDCEKGLQLMNYSTEIFEASHPEFLIDTKKLLAFFKLHEADLRGYLSYRILINQLQELEHALNIHCEIEDEVLLTKLRAIEDN